METNILLENGTNELEVLEFTVGSNHYGINVAKVREIVGYQTVTKVPNSHPHIEGVFIPRDKMIAVINLPKHLNMDVEPNLKSDMMLITNFNKLNVAFRVQSVVGIHRLSWADIVKPDDNISEVESSIATGVIEVNNKTIVILDFEKIVTDISPETGLKVSEIDQLGERNRNETPILMAEDSPLLSKLILDSLHKAEYTNVITTSNGQEAWDYIMKCKEDGTVKDKVKCIITDIEMPLMDGHHLTKLVKSDAELNTIPVVIFSSLVNEEMRRKGESLGADAQLSKPEIGNLVRIIDGLLDN